MCVCVCAWAHTPAAIHSSSSFSSRSTILELSLPEGERKVGVDSATLRSADKEPGGFNTHTDAFTQSLIQEHFQEFIFVPWLTSYKELHILFVGTAT